MSIQPFVAYVAPDFIKAKYGSVDQYNVLVVRPQYRIALQFNPQDVDLLFEETVESKRGRALRLHPLSYLSRMPDAVAAPGNPAEQAKYDALISAHDVCWPYFCRKEGPKPVAPNHLDNKKELLKQLGDRILEGGTLPEPRKKNAAAKAENFRKVFAPGGFAMIDEDISNDYFDEGSDPKDVIPSDSNLFKFRTDQIKANKGLGLLPLVAKVEKKYPDQTEWEPVEGAGVYFQLVPPDPEPNEIMPVEMTNNQKLYVAQALQSKMGTSADDPQFANVHKDVGGKRGEDVGGNDRLKHVFLTDIDHDGFHKAAAGNAPAFNNSRDGGRKDYAQAKASTRADVPHAVRCSTNELGEAGVLFAPSLIGGERYKIRAFIGEPTILCDGKEIEENPDVPHVTETGTFVVWRQARVCHVWASPEKSYNLNKFDEQADNKRGRARRQRNYKNDKIGVGPKSRMYKEFNKGYMEVLFDEKKQERVPWADYRRAHERAHDKVVADEQANYPDYNVSLLLLRTPDKDNPCWAQMMAFAEYERQRAALVPADPRDIDEPNLTSAEYDEFEELGDHMLNWILFYLGSDGLLPGISIIRAPRPYPTTHYEGVLYGMAQNSNGCYMFRNNDEQGDMTAKDPMEIVAIHEASHSWIYRHQDTGSGDEDGDTLMLHEHYFTGGAAGTPRAGKICLMSYHDDSEFLCGKCLLAVRGWNVGQLTVH